MNKTAEGTEKKSVYREKAVNFKKRQSSSLSQCVLKMINQPALFREDYTNEDKLTLDKSGVRKWKPRLSILIA